jgi:hypothetical protein
MLLRKEKCSAINNTMRIFIAYIISVLAFVCLPGIVQADWINPRDELYQTPYRNFSPVFFPSCLPSRGDITAYYPTGIHGIPGDIALYDGADIVYSMGNDNYLQCYCPPQGVMGKQTNWLSSKNITQEEKMNLLQLGWYYIPSGKDWGLADESYLTLTTTQLSCVRPLSPR